MAVNPSSFLGQKEKTTRVSVNAQPTQQMVDAPHLKEISRSLTNIVNLLQQQNKQAVNDAEVDRREKEKSRRSALEQGLESAFSTVKTAAAAIVAPVQNILKNIIDYFMMLFLGKAFLNLLNWFSDPNNKGKIKSILRFLTDWWPTLLAAYILFGTGFGKLTRSLVGIASRGVIALGKVLVSLTKAIFRARSAKTAATATSGVPGGGGWKGALVKLGIFAAGTAVGAVSANAISGGEESQSPTAFEPVPNPPPALGAFGGGLADFKTLFASGGGSAFSPGFNPFTMFFGGGGPGKVMGKKGIDKIPAMLTDGEFVMSRGAVQKFGVGTLEAMNAAGGGTNKPKIVRGIPHAYGGGYVGSGETMGGVGELRQKYDAKHGAGAYDKESSRRKGIANQGESPRESLLRLESYNKPRPPMSASDSEAMRKRLGITKFTPYTPPQPASKQTKSSLSFESQSQRTAREDAARIRNKKTAEQQELMKVNKAARDEYLKIINNPDDPRYQDAWDGKISIDSLKVDIQSKQNADSSSGYKPYVSRFAGARDVAHERAKGIQPSRPYVNPFSMGGMFGGPGMTARQEYAKSKGKYYSSSDQKTYANYGDALAAKKSRMTSLASQQRLDKLSFAGASRNKSRGVRIDAEDVARRDEFRSRGGLMGQLGRFGQRLFGDQGRLDAEQKASEARVKQAGASSIGRYYSSSDGKYYKDYNAAVAARKARLGKSSPSTKVITPTPKPQPKVVSKQKIAGGGQGGRRGSGSKPSVPAFNSSNESLRKQKNALGVK